MKRYEVVIQGVRSEMVDSLVLALYYAGYDVYETSDGYTAFTATDEQVTELKEGK